MFLNMHILIQFPGTRFNHAYRYFRLKTCLILYVITFNYFLFRYSYPGYLRPQDIYEMVSLRSTNSFSLIDIGFSFMNLNCFLFYVQNYPNVYGGPQFPVPLYPPYYQPFYGYTKHLVPTSYVKKTQFPEPITATGWLHCFRISNQLL